MNAVSLYNVTGRVARKPHRLFVYFPQCLEFCLLSDARERGAHTRVFLPHGQPCCSYLRSKISRAPILSALEIIGAGDNDKTSSSNQLIFRNSCTVKRTTLSNNGLP